MVLYYIVMPKPIVVILGRPNVGKSTLFNRIVGRRAAIVEDIPGVTRDRNYMDARWDDRSFVVVDTGGFYPEKRDDIFGDVREQALFAVDEASVIIHLLDGSEGLVSSDRDIASILRASGKRVIWAVNKLDGPKKSMALYEFYGLGAEPLLPVSAKTGYNFEEFMDSLVSAIPPYEDERVEYPKVAVVGRPNVGKSTLVNSLIGKERLIVSPTAGTTRDSIDSLSSYYKKKYLLIDTAGIRKKGKRGYSIERFAMVRTLRSIERCDVALVLIEAPDGITAEDKKIAGLVHDYGKGAVFLLNKWDLVKGPDKMQKELTAELKRKLWFFGHAPVLTTSGLERKRVTKVFSLIDAVMAERKKKVPRGELNRFFEDALKFAPLPTYGGKKVRLYYMNQVSVEPPAFTVFSNRPERIGNAIIRYLENGLRKRFSFKGTPIVIMKRKK